jgi:hypothetical protein
MIAATDGVVKQQTLTGSLRKMFNEELDIL